MPLCNQGCHTHVYFRDGRPYNVSDDEPHEKTCQSLKIGKYWGGYYNTIPMDRIMERVQKAYDEACRADESKNVYDMVSSVKSTRQFLSSVLADMLRQKTKNEKWKEEFQKYKTSLVAQQTLREERKNRRMQGQPAKFPTFTTADQEYKDDIFKDDVAGHE